jgi:hypothetical protein
VDKNLTAWLLAVVAMILFAGVDLVLQSDQASPVYGVRFVSPFRAVGGIEGTSEDYANELVTLENAGQRAVDFSGWTLSNGLGEVFAFPSGFVLPVGAQVALHSTCGENTAADLYWCSGHAVWDDKKDTARLRTADGRVEAIYAYGHTCSICGSKR